MRIEPAISIDARIQEQANVVAVGQNSIHERPARVAEFLFSLGIPEQILSIADGHIGMHAAPVYANHRLRQKRGGQAHVGGHLTAD